MRSWNLRTAIGEITYFLNLGIMADRTSATVLVAVLDLISITSEGRNMKRDIFLPSDDGWEAIETLKNYVQGVDEQFTLDKLLKIKERVR